MFELKCACLQFLFMVGGGATAQLGLGDPLAAACSTMPVVTGWSVLRPAGRSRPDRKKNNNAKAWVSFPCVLARSPAASPFETSEGLDNAQKAEARDDEPTATSTSPKVRLLRQSVQLRQDPRMRAL